MKYKCFKSVLCSSVLLLIINVSVAESDEFVVTPKMESYVLGATDANAISEYLINELKLDLDKDVVLSGFTDSLNDKNKYTEEEMQKITQSLQEKIQKKQIEYQQRLVDKNMEQGKAYQTEFAKQKDVIKTESGLLYKIIEAGSDKKPDRLSIVTINYTGKLVDGTIFEETQKPQVMPMMGVMLGFQEALQLIGTGGKLEIVIPPELGYGDKNIPGILPNSTLHFNLELLDIKKMEN